MVEVLRNGGVGRWRVTTRTGTRYVLDLDRQGVRRIPAAGGSSDRMRRDNTDVHLVQVVECRIGAPLVLRINLGVPGVSVTTRMASDVTRIRLAHGSR
jgi:hypothetical protein